MGDVGQYTIAGSLPSPPTANLAIVSPNPRNSAVGTVGVTFNEAVTGVDLSDFHLTRNGINVPLSGVPFSGSGSSYSIDLTSLTALAGNYVLSLVASGSGITDLSGSPLNQDASDVWLTDTTPPTASIAAVTPSPRNSPSER